MSTLTIAQTPLPVIRTLVHNEITALTSNPNSSVRQPPLMSASGNKIVYSIPSPMRIFTINPDGSGQQQVDAYAAGIGCATLDITADGSKVLTTDACVGNSNSTQVRIVDGAGARALITLSGELYDARISGDGTKVVFMVRRDPSQDPKIAQRGVYIINPDGTGLRQIAGPTSVSALLGSGATPDSIFPFATNGPTLGISTDGSRIVFGSAGPGGERIFGINSDGTGLHVILGPYNFVSHAGISGDGKKALYDVIPFPCCSTPNEAGVVNFDGTGKLALASGSTRYPIGYPGSDDTMQISSDGSKLLLGSTSFLYDTSSGTVLQLASVGGFFSSDPPTLIYDGMFRATMNGAATRFVYLAGDSNSVNQLVTMDLNPSSLGVAPAVSSATLNPSFLLVNQANSATMTSQVSSTIPVSRVAYKFFSNGQADDNIFGGSNVLLGSGTSFSFSGVVAGSAAKAGPRTIRVKAEAKASDGKRHATAVEFGPVTVGTSAPAIPTLSSLTPNSGTVGSQVTIAGTGFDTTAANNSVLFGSQAATVTSASATSLVVTAPSSLSLGTVNVTVSVQGQVSNSLPFTVTQSGTTTPPTVNHKFVHNEITALTSNPSSSVRQPPLMSASGNKIVYSIPSPIRIFTINPDGSGQQQVDAYAAGIGCATLDITADGSKVLTTDACVGNSNSTQVRIVDGAGARALITLSGELYDARISGDGTKVVFMVRRDPSQDPKIAQRGVYTINPDGTGLRQIAGPTSVSALLGATADSIFPFATNGPTLGISSDGSRIVFGSAGPGGERIFGINSDGTGLHVILGPYNFVSHAGISGDGKKALYDVIPFPCCSTPNEAGVVNFDGTGKLALASSSGRYPIGYPGSDDTMQISADGSKLLLGSTSFLYDTSSGTVLQLASVGGFFSSDPPTLIYDGMFRATMNGAATRFVYLAGDSNSVNQLVTMDLDPSSAGLAPGIPGTTLNPTFLLVNQGNSATLTSQVTSASPITRAAYKFFSNGQADNEVFGNSNVLLPSGGNYTASVVAGSAAKTGQRTIRVKAETKASDGKRHAAAMEFGPVFVVTSLPAVAPALTSVVPFSGTAGTQVTITGTGFDAAAANNGVFFGTQTAPIMTASATSLTVLVPSGLTPGPLSVTVSTLGKVSNTFPFTVIQVGTTPPTVNNGGVVGGASFMPSVTAAAIASVFGTNFTASATGAASLPLPTTLGGVTVYINNIPVPLFFVSSSQINFQIPWEVLGLSQVTITATTTGGNSTTQTVSLGSIAPGLFSINSSGKGQGAIQIANTSIFAATAGSIPGAQARPATQGDFLTIYCSGMGDVTNRPASGAAAGSGANLSQTKINPTVTIGGVNAPVTFSGLSPGFVGLYQVNVQVPGGIAGGGSVPLIVTLNSVQSNMVTIAVQ